MHFGTDTLALMMIGMIWDFRSVHNVDQICTFIQYKEYTIQKKNMKKKEISSPSNIINFINVTLCTHSVAFPVKAQPRGLLLYSVHTCFILPLVLHIVHKETPGTHVLSKLCDI